LGEGVTGQVMDRRRPVVLASYGAVPAGHLPAGHPASRGAVAAVPIWWLGEVIGANVVFAGGRSQFTATEVDEQKVPILRAYLKRWKAEVGVFFDGVGPDSPDEQMRAAAAKHPVFRLGDHAHGHAP